MTNRAWFSAFSHASACSSGMARVRFRNDFSFPFNCLRSSATVSVELRDIKLRPLTHAAPQDRANLLMDLEHVTFGFFARITEHTLKNHCDVGHQIYRIVMHHDLPGQVQFVFFPGLRFMSWSFNGGS